MQAPGAPAGEFQASAPGKYKEASAHTQKAVTKGHSDGGRSVLEKHTLWLEALGNCNVEKFSGRRQTKDPLPTAQLSTTVDL